jgi:DNA-(apurinic or apyrimidinic site) lyase
MDVGVLTVPLGDRPLEDTLAYLAGAGVDAVELGCGGYPGSDHLPPGEFLDDATAQGELHSRLDDHGLTVSALATHNNPLHPDPDRAEAADAELRDAVRLAGQLNVDVVTCFSGLPGGSPDDETPNWITAPWPPEHLDALQHQWDVATEYWTELEAYASSHDVYVAIEMHPNMLVSDPHGLVRLREATGDRVGANFDPSHLYWQSIDPIAAIRYLGDRDAIHHVHAKDTELYPEHTRTKGVLDTTPYDEEADRSWLFRTVGYGHGERHWKRIVSALRLVGYDGVLSIEHEDALTSSREGLEKAIELLSRCVFETTPDEPHWVET